MDVVREGRKSGEVGNTDGCIEGKGVTRAGEGRKGKYMPRKMYT